MSNQVIEQLRRAIEQKHEEALHALETLQRYFEESKPENPPKQAAAKKKAPRAGTGKIRNAVLAVLRKDYFPVAEVAKQTGLKPLQVRGVVTAPSLKDDFAKKEVDGVIQYKYKGSSQEGLNGEKSSPERS